jgi:hypothetical protein
MPAAEWAALSWDLQETYLAGLTDDPEVPFSINRETQPAARPAARGGTDLPFSRREAVAGAQVIDLNQMISELESNPDARKRQ